MTRAAPMAPDDRRKAIIDAVIPLLVDQGANVTTRQIAEAAGVAEGTLFRVFPDKCELMHAAARATIDPATSRADLLAIDPGLDLPDTVRAVADLLLRKMDQVIAVMVAVRGSDIPAGRGSAPRTGPPQFVVDANVALLAALTELFDRHRAALAVSPEQAALVVRALVFGSRHPGMGHGSGLSADQIAAVVVNGISRTGGR